MLKKLSKITALGLSASMLMLASHSVTAHGPDGHKEASASQQTTLFVHFPSPLRKDTQSFINKDFTDKTGHTVSIYMKRSSGFSKALNDSVKAGELNHSVLMSYGRTGELPPGRDIFKHLNNSRDLMKVMPNHLDLRDELSAFNDPKGQMHFPFFETMVILYNPKLIQEDYIPTTWAALADFPGKIALPGRGCYAVRTLVSLYHTVGAEKFEEIIKSANIPNLKSKSTDAIRPLKNEDISKALLEGKFEIGVATLTSKRVLKAIADGKLAVMWPEDGAFAFPYPVAVKKGATKAELALFNYITKDADLHKELLTMGLSSSLSNGQVLPIVKENNFNYKFIPIKTLMDTDTHERVISIVQKHN